MVFKTYVKKKRYYINHEIFWSRDHFQGIFLLECRNHCAIYKPVWEKKVSPIGKVSDIFKLLNQIWGIPYDQTSLHTPFPLFKMPKSVIWSRYNFCNFDIYFYIFALILKGHKMVGWLELKKIIIKKNRVSSAILTKENSVYNDVLSHDIPWFSILKISSISASERIPMYWLLFYHTGI